MPGSAVLGSSGAILGTIILGQVSTPTIIYHNVTISQTFTLTDLFIETLVSVVPEPDSFGSRIITQGFLSPFIIPQGYDSGLFVPENPPINRTITSILRLIDQFIIAYGTNFILDDTLFLTDSFITEGHTQRILSDFLFLQEPFITIRVDNRTITSPSWIVYVVKKGLNNVPIIPSYTVLYSINGSILLPNPIFGDTQESVNEVLINQTVGGKRFSYVKTSKRKKLEYKFEFRLAKMNELQRFLDDSNMEWLTLVNFKEEIWNVKITNNPIVYEGISQGWFSVTLDMEGYLVQRGIYHCFE